MKSEVYSQLYNIISENKLSDVLDEIAAVCFDEGEKTQNLTWYRAGKLIETLAERNEIKAVEKL